MQRASDCKIKTGNLLACHGIITASQEKDFGALTYSYQAFFYLFKLIYYCNYMTVCGGAIRRLDDLQNVVSIHFLRLAINAVLGVTYFH